jgi:hypothetical protein
MNMDKKELLKTHELLCESYIKLMNDKEVMLNFTKPQLESMYASKIGVLQIEILKLQLEIKALKRQIEMAQAEINQNKVPNFDQIEADIAGQLLEAQMEIMFKTYELEVAKQFLSHLASPDKKVDIRKIFRRLAKALHPDVNPELSSSKKEIWNKVLWAYEHGDMEQLKALEIIYAKEISESENAKNEMSEDELNLLNHTLSEGIGVLEQQITELNNSFPFSMREQILNEDWINGERSRLQLQMEELKTYGEEQKQKYALIKAAYE